MIVSEDMKEYYQVTLHDISKRKKELEELALQADYDQLTKLYNRRGLEKIIEVYTQQRKPFTMLLIDLNRFKQVNDVYGHESGDEVLIFVADKLKKAIRPEDFGCRWGGDEFVILLSDTNEEKIRAVASRLHELIVRPYYLSKFKKNVHIGGSMGGAFYPKDDQSIQGIIDKADQAMYRVKRIREDSPEKFLLFYHEYILLDDQPKVS